MEKIKLGKSDISSSRLVYGCMRIAGSTDETRETGKKAVRTAIEEGITHFDHADIYGAGRSEEVFGEVLKDMPGIREKIIITSKCGIIPNRENDTGRYDFSKEHITKSVEGSLSRLGIEQLNLLLLHRPDYLFDAEIVSETFQDLRAAGKVHSFGVSNFRPSQVSLLQSACPMPLLMNQVEINIHNINSLLDGTLDQCQELQISPQAWCPLGGVVYPGWGNTFSEEDEARIKDEFDLQSKSYDAEHWIIMLAWLLKHPAGILPIIGTTNPERIKMAKQALAIDYTHKDWYRLLEARNGKPVP